MDVTTIIPCLLTLQLVKIKKFNDPEPQVVVAYVEISFSLLAWGVTMSQGKPKHDVSRASNSSREPLEKHALTRNMNEKVVPRAFAIQK